MEVEKSSLLESFSPNDHIINIIRRAALNSQDVIIESPSHERITLLVKDHEYFSDVVDMKNFCRINASLFKVTVLNKKKLQSYKTGIGRNIDELLWQAGFYASNGQLMEGCAWDDVIELCYWPNFTRIPLTPNFLRIASLLNRNPISIEHPVALLKISRKEVYQFYSAAICAGVVKKINCEVKEPRLKPHRNQALLSLLLNRISRI